MSRPTNAGFYKIAFWLLLLLFLSTLCVHYVNEQRKQQKQKELLRDFQQAIDEGPGGRFYHSDDRQSDD